MPDITLGFSGPVILRAQQYPYTDRGRRMAPTSRTVARNTCLGSRGGEILILRDPTSQLPSSILSLLCSPSASFPLVPSKSSSKAI